MMRKPYSSASGTNPAARRENCALRWRTNCLLLSFRILECVLVWQKKVEKEHTHVLAHSSASRGTVEFNNGLRRAAGAVIEEKTLGSLIFWTRGCFTAINMAVLSLSNCSKSSITLIAKSILEVPEML